MVPLDCASQRDFTCDVSDITTGNYNPSAGWRINGLSNISAVGGNGITVANNNIRVTTTTGGNVPTSTITIDNFDMRDDGGTVQCINTDDDTIQGTATIGEKFCLELMISSESILDNLHLLTSLYLYVLKAIIFKFILSSL